MSAVMKSMLAGAASLLLVACNPPRTTDTTVPRGGEQQLPSVATQRGQRERQMEFLNRIRAADPQERTIKRALLNENNELGLILGREVEMDKIAPMMRKILTEMAKEFPGEDLTVIAYTPSNPPQEIGTARLNARTRDMTYTPRG
jgi:hypothetical protein